TISQNLRTRAAATPDQPFVKCGDDWISFRELDEASDRAAAGLADLGVVKGDRIGFFLSTSEELVVLFFACFEVGAVFVPLNIYLKGQFRDYQLRDSGIAILVVDDAGLEAAMAMLDQTDVKWVVLVGKADAERAQMVVPYATLVSGTGPVPGEV